MTKVKYLLTLLFVGIILLISPTIVNAADTFKTDDGITVKKVVTGFSNGNIGLDISNITLSSEGNYEWSIGTSSSVDNITKWYVLGDMNASKSTAKIELTVQDRDILAILRKTNTAYLFIKDSKATEDTSDDTLLVSGLQIDLTLPSLYAFDIIEDYVGLHIIGGDLSSVDKWDGATYNISTAYYKFEKITDETLVEKYKKALTDGTSLTEVFSIDVAKIEAIENWNACTADYSNRYTCINESKMPTDQGAYYLWVKAKDTDSKTVYGCLIVNIDADGPIVEKIYVSSPEAGTYKTGQTVKIRVGFSEEITGSSVPTLKIKFGESAVREVTNGTIVNTGSGNYYWAHYIEYSYNIQDSDKGQLATVDLTGGNIKDSSGNEATLSCPVITGNTIKANVEGTTTNNTQNQDTTTTVSVESVSLNQTKITLEKGKTATLVATVKPTNATNTAVTYKSSNESIAKVDSKGVITAVAKGTATITVTTADGQKTATCEVTVTDVANTADGTKAPGKIPQAGMEMGIIVAIVAVIIAGAVVYSRYKKMSDI